MINYSDIYDYFSNKKTSSLSQIFAIFLHQRAFSGNEVTLLAEFESFAILPEDEKSTAWDIMLRKEKDERNLPVIAYALSGDISPNRFNWLLEQVKPTLMTYNNLPYSLIAIAATFGQNERLDALLKAGYQPSPNELKEGLFVAAYFGHQAIFKSIFNKLAVPFHTLRDTDGNAPLHVAVMNPSGNQEIIDYLVSQDTTQVAHFNHAGHRPVDSAVLSSGKLLLDKLVSIHQVCSVEVDYTNILRHLAKSTIFSEIHGTVQVYICDKYNQDPELMTSLVRDAIAVGNKGFIQEILFDLPLMIDLSELVEYAKTQPHQPIVFLLGEESLFKAWVLMLRTNFSKQYEEYLDKKSGQLISRAKANITGMSPIDKKAAFREMLDRFLNDRNIRKILKEKYLSFTEGQIQRSYCDSVVLPQQELSSSVKSKDYALFKICLLQTMQLSEPFQDEVSLDADEKDTPKSDMVDDLTDTQVLGTLGDYVLEPQITYTPKVRLFVDTFAEEFDRTYRFYMCLSTGELLKRPDATDQLAEVAKKAAGILPNVSVSAAALGIPLPLSIDFPSSVAVVAVIDLCMYIREHNQLARAKRIERFFAGTTLYDRTEIIYDCAKSMARQFYDQIEKLDTMKGGIPYFAEIAVVRLFEYMVKCDENVQSSGRSRLLAFFRKLMSTIIDVGPEPEIVQKPLSRVAGDALSIQHHLVFYKNDAEEYPLLLDIAYRDITRQDPNKQWTAKGIFEHTGIWAENGQTYCGRNQNIEKYGYIYSTIEDANYRNMSLCTRTSWVHTRTISESVPTNSASAIPIHTDKKKSSSWINLNFLNRGGDVASQSEKMKSPATVAGGFSAK